MLASQTGIYDETSPHNLLLHASSKGDLQHITELIEKGVNVNDYNEIGQTALLAASIANKTEACALLLEYGANVDHTDIGGYTALHLTTDAELTNLLLRYIKKEELINARTKYNRTPLHEAAFRGSSGKVFALLSNHAEVNAEDVNKATALHYAVARSGDVDVSFVEALIEAGADVNKQNIFLQTPLAIACKQHQFMRNIITILLKAGADPVIQANDGNTALHVLFFGTNLFEPNLSVDVVEELVGANKKCLETINLYCELPLHGALSKRRNEKIALRLLTYDAVMSESTDNLGRTILHLACEKDYLSIIEKYVENPTVINATDCLGRSTLHYSCMHSEDGNSVKLIFQSKTFRVCGLVDCFGYTAYQYAKARPSEVGKKLLNHFDDHVRRTHCNSCMTDTAVLRKYSEVFKDGSEQLSSLLTKMVVDTN
ncbi:putative ankyrin repeat protein RF_0381 [Mercenaria mercenaria]|uniref:putative ankyrin repeat protein RF_0381 n=1 Tax=Mercenaria mercenaria TaxID=6596 RepID=UPI00234EFBCF|nr:putative ankyrin repeat protein RF_0381 [Mercenaria mercenaria]